MTSLFAEGRMKTMATIIQFPGLSKTYDPQALHSDIQKSGSSDLTTLMEQIQNDLASIRAYFVMMQRDPDLLVSEEKDA